MEIQKFEYLQNEKCFLDEIKITHMWRRWSTPQNFFFAFIDELEKQLLKKLLKWANKKQISSLKK